MPPASGLYDPRFEHDACGVSFVVDVQGRKSHDIVAMGIGALCRMEHRGATGAEVETDTTVPTEETISDILITPIANGLSVVAFFYCPVIYLS